MRSCPARWAGVIAAARRVPHDADADADGDAAGGGVGLDVVVGGGVLVGVLGGVVDVGLVMVVLEGWRCAGCDGPAQAVARPITSTTATDSDEAARRGRPERMAGAVIVRT
jgi:hypothetical protein